MSSIFARLGATTAAAIIGFAAVTVATVFAEQPAPPDKPFLWRVEGNELVKPSHLFGTIHLSNERIAKLHPAAERAFVESGTLHTEISLGMADQMNGAMLMMRRDGKKLSESIGPELTEEIKKHIQAIQPGLDIAILQPMKTWAAAMMVVMLPHQLKGRQALDLILWNRAREMEKSTAALETIEDQVAAFEILNEEEQIIYLRETLAAIEKGEEMIPRLIAAYESGDAILLEKLFAESMELDGDDEVVRKLSDRMIHALITSRDITMATKIHDVLTENPDQAHFFAIGTAHFLGDASIRKHLVAKGYTITRILE